MTAAQRVFIFLLVLVVVQSIYHYPQLPERVASHFDANGRPNGWMTRDTFIGFYWGMAGLAALIFLGLPRFLRRAPNKRINLPRREYWLAPERRAETVAYLGRQLLWMGSATLMFSIGVFHLAIQANLTDAPRLSPAAFPLIVAYLIFTLLWVVRLVFKFRKTG